jgi:hypothetical protein
LIFFCRDRGHALDDGIRHGLSSLGGGSKHAVRAAIWHVGITRHQLELPLARSAIAGIETDRSA